LIRLNTDAKKKEVILVSDQKNIEKKDKKKDDSPKKIETIETISKAFSEMPKLGMCSPKDFSFLSEKKSNKLNLSENQKLDRFSKLPAISEG